MSDSALRDCIRGRVIFRAKQDLAEIKKAIKNLDRALNSKDETEVKLGYMALNLLSDYLRKRLPLECVEVLNQLKGQEKKDNERH